MPPPYPLFSSLSSHLLTFSSSWGWDEERGRECGKRMRRRGAGEEGEVQGERGKKESKGVGVRVKGKREVNGEGKRSGWGEVEGKRLREK